MNFKLQIPTRVCVFFECIVLVASLVANAGAGDAIFANGFERQVSLVTYTNDVQPIFFVKCAPCHTGLGVGGHDIGTDYLDAFLQAFNQDCTGLNVAECSLVLIQNGEMPANAGCTGDPVQDAGNADCLTQIEQDTVQAWIDLGLLE